MADITLVNMNMLYIKYMDGHVRRQCHLPLGPLYLISALKNHDIEVDFRDYQLLEADELFNHETLCDFLKDPSPIIGLSFMANLLPFVLYAIPYLKERYPNHTIILGGVGTAAIEDEILQCIPQIDIIYRGEGDNYAPELIKALKEKKSFKTLPNISFRKNGKIIHNPSAQRITDLDTLPRPSYQGLDFKKYIGHNILGSRGCPYPCTFCSITPIWGWKAYSRSNQDIINEMKEMSQNYGVKQFLFQDEYFVSSPERMIEFVKLLTESGLDITYKVFARIDLVNEESMKAMVDSGCVEIRFGIESGSDKVLKMTQKGFNSNKALKAISKAKKIFRSVDAFYVWGFPFETIEDFNESLFQMITFRGMGVRVLPSLLTYLPQTGIYNDIEDKNSLEFCSHLLPEYMISGIERRGSVRVTIDDKYSDLFKFILKNKNLFPGLFHIDVENNITPKLELLEEFDFYHPVELPTDSCGAHSPSKDELSLTLNV